MSDQRPTVGGGVGATPPQQKSGVPYKQLLAEKEQLQRELDTAKQIIQSIANETVALRLQVVRELYVGALRARTLSPQEWNIIVQELENATAQKTAPPEEEEGHKV